MTQHFAEAYPYAEALLLLAKQDNTLDEWSQILATLSFVATDRRVTKLLQNRQITEQQLGNLFNQVLLPLWQKSRVSEQAQIFLQLLLKYRRANIVSEIETLYKNLRAKEENSAEALVTSSIDLTKEQKVRLEKALTKRVNKKIVASFTLDKSIVGGIKVQIGNTVIDGTVANSLRNLHRKLNSETI